MGSNMKWKRSLSWLTKMASAVLLVLACGRSPSKTPAGTVALTLSDSPTEDWSIIGVKVLSISLVPKGGGAPVVIYSESASVPWINLVQLDQLGEIVANAEVAVGTYSKALVTISANPGDVQLTSSSDPEASFALAANTMLPSDEIKIRNASGPAGSLTAQVGVKLAEDLVVTDSKSSSLDLEFELGHPAFLVEHAAATGTPIWTINFEGTLRHHPMKHLAQLVLRHQYGLVTDVSAASFIMSKAYPVRPVTAPETATLTDNSITVNADAANGTLVYDVDAGTRTVMKDFTSLTTLPGKYLRVAARFQDDGSLFAVRAWVSQDFEKVWLDPEGHLLHVNTTTDRIWVESESGLPVPVMVDASTQFFFRSPANAAADATPIGTGTDFLKNLHRGFKVHLSVSDPLSKPWVADTIEVEIARFDGAIALLSPAGTGFTYTRKFVTLADDYVQNLPYLSPTTPNGYAADGAAILGFDFWDFAFPTLSDTGASAIPDYESAVGGSVNFGGTVGALKVWGESYAVWADPANPTGWAARFTVLDPIPAPLGKVATTWVASPGGGSFGMDAVFGGASAVTTSLSTLTGSATLVYQIDRTNGVVTITFVDISTASGLATLTSSLKADALVKAYGVPQTNGTLAAYVLFYYTGTAPSN
jgi:hypothetical protein